MDKAQLRLEADRQMQEIAGALQDENFRLTEEVERLERELEAANETINKAEDSLKAIFGAREYVKPGTGIYLTTKIALEYIKERRGAGKETT